MSSELKDSTITLLKELTDIVPRRGLGEQRAVSILKKNLNQNKVLYEIQKFETTIPLIKTALLMADGKKIPCLGASYVSGKLDKSTTILSTDESDVNGSMIIYNPKSLGICLQTLKNYPAVAINKDFVHTLKTASNISGDVAVERMNFESQNILIGNKTNPSKIVFAHYDALIGPGALDNAGGVVILFQTILENRKLLENNLFVFIGSEEESYSSREGLYGFKMFDKSYNNLLKNTQKILVIDGVGITSPSMTKDYIDWVFALHKPDTNLINKTVWMQNDQDKVMEIYHTDLDKLDILVEQYLLDAKALLEEELK